MKLKHIAWLAFPLLLTSCKDNEIFEKEMYKNVIALISSNYHNTFQELVPLTGEEEEGYIAASVGGNHAPTKNMVINLEEDPAPLQRYNRSLYDEAENLYAKMLPKDKYLIEDYKIQVNSGERTGRTKVKLKVDGLNPDSTYFISLKSTETESSELNPKKSTILYQVQIKNDYASQATNSLYTVSGFADGIQNAGNKKLFPISKNKVRLIAGMTPVVNNREYIDQTSILLEIGDDNKVSIKPFKDLEVTQLDGDDRYPNTYKVEESFGKRFHVFSLKYEFTLKGKKAKKTVIQEELRTEIIK